MTTPLSLAAYARLRGVSTVAVSKAIAAGRLVESVTRDGRGAPKIADPDLADREWTANTRPSVADATPSRPRPPPAPPAPPATSPARRDVPDYNESRARREAALADMAELEVAERRGELVEVATARADVENVFTLVRTRILSVPSLLAQRLPGLTGEVREALEDLLREALEEMARDGAAG